MNVAIRLAKVEFEVLKELQKKDNRYKRGLKEKVEIDIGSKYGFLRVSSV